MLEKTHREIKFRGWHTVQKKMFSAIELAIDQLTILPTGGFINVHSGSTRLSEIYPQDKFIPLQYTGLKDKNGKEIYERDIVKYRGEYFIEIADVVWYGTGSWGLHDREKYLDELVFSQAIRYDSFSGKPIYTEMEVIGNIYENSELLEAK